jgi:DNA polymerase-4
MHAKGAAFLKQHFGSFGERLFELSQGIDDREVSNKRDTKSVSVEHTFAQDITHKERCFEQIDALQQELQKRYLNLKQARVVTGLFVKMKFHDFTQTTVEQQANLTQQFLFRDLLNQAYDRGRKPVRLIGLGYRLAPVDNNQYQQLSLSI